MKKTDQKMDAVEWINNQIDRITECLLKVLNAHYCEDLAGVQHEVAVGIHNVALFNVLKTVNFSLQLPQDLEQAAQCVLAYDAFANEECHKLLEFCKRLAQWRPETSNAGGGNDAPKQKHTTRAKRQKRNVAKKDFERIQKDLSVSSEQNQALES